MKSEHLISKAIELLFFVLFILEQYYYSLILLPVVAALACNAHTKKDCALQ